MFTFMLSFPFSDKGSTFASLSFKYTAAILGCFFTELHESFLGFGRTVTLDVYQMFGSLPPQLAHAKKNWASHKLCLNDTVPKTLCKRYQSFPEKSRLCFLSSSPNTEKFPRYC